MPIQTNLQPPQQLFAKPVRYEVPAFQRRYVWQQEEQWEPLWSDVEELAQSIMEDVETKPHFMGAVVLQQTRFPTGTIERRIVVDGQQRLTTLQLLIDAIQEVLEGRGHTDPAKRLATLVLNQQAFHDGDPDNAFKVWPTVVDRVAFRHAMSNDLSATEYWTSRIVQAHEFFKGQSEQWLDRFPVNGVGTRDEAAAALENAMRMQLVLVVIDLGDTDDPHVIFETLNARGTPLLQSDMIKNKILHDADIDVEDESVASSEALRLWPFDNDDWWAKEVGRGFQRRPRIDGYLNHWLTLRNGKEMRAYDEFRAFERYTEDRKSAGETIHDVASDLRKVGEIFRDVEEVRRMDISKFLERRNVMNVGVVTPLLLWLLSEDVPQATLANCLTALESFLVRRVLCGLSARRYGAFFVEIVARLSATPAVEEADKVLISHLAAQTAQATLWPGDDDLCDRFLSAPLYHWLTRGRLRMVLTGIEEQLRTEGSETQEAPVNLQIEHVMPQAWRNKWPIADGDYETETRRDRAIHTIGNLTLVNGRLNICLSNGPWDKKKKALAKHSVLFLNKHLVQDAPQVWDEAAIEERARWLHASAVKVWPHFGK